MGHEYKIMKAERIVFEIFVGQITKDELLEHDGDLFRDPDLPSAPSVLVDISGASFDPAIGEGGFGELLQLYAEHRDKTHGAKVAVVAPKNFQKAKLYERRTASLSMNVIVFNQIDHACIWLGVETRKVQEWIASRRTALLSSSGCLK